MKVNRLNPECIRCLVKKYIEGYPDNISKDEKLEYMQGVMRLIAEAPKTVSAPEIVNEINRLQEKMFGAGRDYSDIKHYFNKLMLDTEPMLKKELDRAEDALMMAVRYVMMGNYIDFGAMDKVDENKLRELIENAEDIKVNDAEFESLRRELMNAETLVYLTDNCGEIVLDKLLISVIRQINPSLEITAIVRGADVLNDATVTDAEQAGLTELVNVIGNGSNIAGTCLDKISEEARSLIDSADVIISKGQGNFETLHKCGRNIYYIFMCKCKMFADRFGVPRYSGMLINDKSFIEMEANI